MKTVRIAILGMGNMGVIHSNALRKIDGVEIVGLCSRRIESCINYNKEYNADYPVYDNFEKMLDEVKPDGVYICLPPYGHSGEAELAASRGIHIFIEKPIAINEERAKSIADAVEKYGVRSQVGYHMRFGGAVEKVKELITSGKAGRPTLFTATYDCNSLHTPWWIKKELCGGQVFEQVIHLYDMAYYLMGDYDTVSGYTANLCHTDVPDYTVEDTSSALIRFKSGALGSITGSNCSVPDRWDAAFKIVCENMVADFTDLNHCTITYTKPEVKTEVLDLDDDATIKENSYFIDVVRGEKAEISPISQGYLGLKAVAAVVKSSENEGMAIKL